MRQANLAQSAVTCFAATPQAVVPIRVLVLEALALKVDGKGFERTVANYNYLTKVWLFREAAIGVLGRTHPIFDDLVQHARFSDAIRPDHGVDIVWKHSVALKL